MNDISFQYAGSLEGVHDLNLTVKKGECVVLTGPSGSGKTTITRLLNGLAPSYYPGTLAGQIYLDRDAISTLAPCAIGRRVGSVFQDPKSQFFSSDLGGEVAFACENYGFSREEIRSRTDAAIHSFSLNPLRNRNLDLLSSGEKQRVAIASVYALGPKVYVCDEPTANLDNEGTKQLGETLKKLKAQGCTLIIAEHRLSWLQGIADRFVYLSQGRISWDRSPEEIAALSPQLREAQGLRETVESVKVSLSPPRGSDPKLKVKSLCCRRKGNEIFSHLDFSVYPGQVTAITGTNGAGKTSLALTVSGLWRESSGFVEINGRRPATRRRRSLIWYSSNDTGTQFFTDRVTQELLLNSPQTRERLNHAQTLLGNLGLYPYKDAHPATLSGGQKQRLSIACGILSGREILIFDEPTSGLDAGNMRTIAEALKAEANKGKTILVITHDHELMRHCCDCEIRL